MSAISKYVKDNFSGMLVFGDIHADLESYMKAYHYSQENKLFFMSLGDLVDRGHFPFEVVHHMYKLVEEGKAGFIIGNHDEKFRRVHRGGKVRFSADSKRTLSDVGPERQEEFLRMYSSIIDNPNYSALFHKFDDLLLVHGASHPKMWSDPENVDNSTKSRALFGEVTGEMGNDGYPVRLYNWINEIPMGKTVLVGHDRMPIFNVAITEPMVRSNPNGGKAIFIDTGCGKSGFLTAAVVIDKKGFEIDHYVDFR